MMEERGFVRKQAGVWGVSGKAGVGIWLKEHDERMKELSEEDERQRLSAEGGEPLPTTGEAMPVAGKLPERL